MKVMFDPYIGSTLSYRSTNNATKQVSKELPKKAEGYSNEEIYNAIMSFKKSVKGIFKPKPKAINTYA